MLEMRKVFFCCRQSTSTNLLPGSDERVFSFKKFDLFYAMGSVFPFLEGIFQIITIIETDLLVKVLVRVNGMLIDEIQNLDNNLLVLDPS